MNSQPNQYELDSAAQAASEATTPSSGSIDIAAVGQKIKQIYPGGVAKDGRSYLDIPDEELGSKFILNNGDKGLAALGMNKPTNDSKEAATLRKEFHNLQEVKDYKNVLDSWNRAKDVPNDGSGDLTLLYSYIKALDPDSVVREGEINISKATASVPENILTAYQRVKEGKLLSEQQRKEYQSEVGRIYNTRAEKVKQSSAFYSGLATDMGADPASVTGGLGEIQMAEITEAKPEEKQESLSGPVGTIAAAGQAVTDFLVPETKKRVGEFVEDPEKALSLVSGNPVGLNQLPSEEQVKNAPAMAELGLTAAGGSAIKAGLPKINQALEATKNLLKPQYGPEKLQEGINLSKVGGELRDTVVQGAKTAGEKVQGNTFYQGVEDWAKQAKRSALKSSEKKAIDDVVQNAKRYKGKIFNPDTVKGIWDTADKGYTSAGKIGDTLTAEYNRVLRDVARTQLEKVAPGWEKGTGMIRQGLEKEKTLGSVRKALEREDIKQGLESPAKKFGTGVAKTAGTGLALYALSKLIPF